MPPCSSWSFACSCSSSEELLELLLEDFGALIEVVVCSQRDNAAIDHQVGCQTASARSRQCPPTTLGIRRGSRGQFSVARLRMQKQLLQPDVKTCGLPA